MAGIRDVLGKHPTGSPVDEFKIASEDVFNGRLYGDGNVTYAEAMNLYMAFENGKIKLSDLTPKEKGILYGSALKSLTGYFREARGNIETVEQTGDHKHGPTVDHIYLAGGIEKLKAIGLLDDSRAVEMISDYLTFLRGKGDKFQKEYQAFIRKLKELTREPEQSRS